MGSHNHINYLDYMKLISLDSLFGKKTKGKKINTLVDPSPTSKNIFSKYEKLSRLSLLYFLPKTFV